MNQIALITGASGTIGKSIAIKLAQEGIDVILHYNKNQEEIKKVEEICKEQNVMTLIVQADLSKIEEINGLFEQINAINFHPNILVNTSGIAHYGLIQDITYTEWVEVINTHVMSSFFCSQKVIPEMVRNRFGRIINISSIWGESGAANEVVYSMAKGAINTFTKSLAKELAPSGITVNAIAPGVVMSRMMEKFTDDEIEDLINQIPMNRFADPIEIAETALHLIHTKSSYITGQIIKIDGGWS